MSASGIGITAPGLRLLAAGEGVSAFSVSLLTIVAAAAIIALIAQRLKLQLIPAYLLAGAMVGPHAFGLVEDPAVVRDIADLAIVLLMFGIGLHLDLQSMRYGAARLISAGVASTVVSIALIAPLALALGAGRGESLAIAMAASLSSTAVVLKILQMQRRSATATGRLCLSVLVIQDIAVIPMLLALPPIARLSADAAEEAQAAGGGDPSAPAELILGGLIALGVVAGIVLVGRFLLPPLLRAAARAGASGGEVLVILSLAFAMCSAGATGAVGLGAGLGAFLSGLLLASTPFRDSVSGQIGTLRDVFLAVFFVAIGMKLNPAVVGQDIGPILLGAVGLLIVKTVSLVLAMWASGFTPRVSVSGGLALAGAGEFGLVILAAALATGAVDSATSQRWIAVIVLTMIVIPMLMTLGNALGARVSGVRMAPWLAKDAKQSGEGGGGVERHGPHVIVAGYGLVGRAVASRLAAHGASVAVVEVNPETVRRQRQLGRRFLYGDVSEPHVLESAGIYDAAALVLTIPDEHAVLRACRTARAMRGDELYIVVRASFVSRGVLATQAGADEFVVEELITASAMEKHVEDRLQHLFVDPEPDEAPPVDDPAEAVEQPGEGDDRDGRGDERGNGHGDDGGGPEPESREASGRGSGD